MFEVSFQKIIVIALLALVVLGPEKLPKIAAQLGRLTGRARSMARNLRQQLEQEVSYDDLRKQKEAAEEALRRATEAPMEFHTYVEPQPAAAPESTPVATHPAPPSPAAADSAVRDAADSHR